MEFPIDCIAPYIVLLTGWPVNFLPGGVDPINITANLNQRAAVYISQDFLIGNYPDTLDRNITAVGTGFYIYDVSGFKCPEIFVQVRSNMVVPPGSNDAVFDEV